MTKKTITLKFMATLSFILLFDLFPNASHAITLPPNGSGAAATGGYWTYATQYVANTTVPYAAGFRVHSKVQVALPDKYVKFCLIYRKCSKAYSSGRSYSINLAFFTDGQAKGGNNAWSVRNMPVGEVGPWNEDDNWWDPTSSWDKARRLFTDITNYYSGKGYNMGYDEAYHAARWGYNGGKDQFSRVITTKPYGPGLDVSTKATEWMRKQGLNWQPSENKWVYISSFNWDY